MRSEFSVLCFNVLFVLSCVSMVLSVSLGCSLLIAPSVFTKVHLNTTFFVNLFFCNILKNYLHRINSASARQNSWYGNSSGPMWLMEPTCNSADNDIALCKAINQYGKGTCPHTHEAGVSCVATNLGKNKYDYLCHGD